MKVLVASTNSAKLKAVEEAFSEYYNDIEVLSKKIKSGVSDTPVTSEETLQGVKNRIKGLEKDGEYDFLVAIESGVDQVEGGSYLFTYALIKKGNRSSLGRSISYPLPKKVFEKIAEGGHLSEIAEQISGEKDIRSKGGFIEFVSKGVINRSKLTKDAIICALFPFVNESIYKE